MSMSTSMTLNDFCNNIGMPEKLKSNRAPEFCGRNLAFLKNLKRKGIGLTYSKPELKNQIWKVDLKIKEMKRRWHNKMRTRKLPKSLCDYDAKYTVTIMQILPRNLLQNRTCYKEVIEKTLYIP